MTDREQQSPLDMDPDQVRQAQDAAAANRDDAGSDPQEAHGGSMAPGLVDDTGHQADDPGDIGGDMADARP